MQTSRTRWPAVALLVALGWLVTPHPVPLYDGIGFPDEPYRFLPARPGAAGPPTVATVSLKVAGGVNTGGIVANSAESGPQVSVFAPPRAFATTGTAPVVVEARPVLPTDPMPAGKADSNVYALSFTSKDGPVTLVPGAQQPTVTMRAVTAAPTLPVFEYRADATAAWKELRTRQVGRDIFTTVAPGAGEFLLVQTGTSSASSSSSRTALYAVLGATVLLMAGVLIGVRVLSRRAST